MSYIIKRKVKNTTYVYEVTSYRNEDGQPRNKQRCLGKLDEDGVLISSKRKLPVQIRKVRTVKEKIILERIVEAKKTEKEEKKEEKKKKNKKEKKKRIK